MLCTKQHDADSRRCTYLSWIDSTAHLELLRKARQHHIDCISRIDRRLLGGEAPPPLLDSTRDWQILLAVAAFGLLAYAAIGVCLQALWAWFTA